MTLTLTCPVNPVNKHTVRLTGSGVLTLRHGCSAHSKEVTLPGCDTVVHGPPLTITRPLLNLTLPGRAVWSGLINISALPALSSLPEAPAVPVDDLMA